jgi:hypothetical protein
MTRCMKNEIFVLLFRFSLFSRKFCAFPAPNVRVRRMKPAFLPPEIFPSGARASKISLPPIGPHGFGGLTCRPMERALAMLKNNHDLDEQAPTTTTARNRPIPLHRVSVRIRILLSQICIQDPVLPYSISPILHIFVIFPCKRV